MTLGAVTILDTLVSHAMSLGLFERVNGHEPVNPPSTGLTCAIWADIVDIPLAGSGLASSDARVIFKVRIFTSMLQEPLDAIDPVMLDAIDVLWTAYIGDFTLGGSVRLVDIRGQAGVRLTAQAGYLDVPDGGPRMRVMTITLPVIINEAWMEAP